MVCIDVIDFCCLVMTSLYHVFSLNLTYYLTTIGQMTMYLNSRKEIVALTFDRIRDDMGRQVGEQMSSADIKKCV